MTYNYQTQTAFNLMHNFEKKLQTIGGMQFYKEIGGVFLGKNTSRTKFDAQF